MRNKVLDHISNGWPQDSRLRGNDELISTSPKTPNSLEYT